MGVSDIGFSEVRSCLVQMPRDGTTVNVLGEEERPSRPKYLFLPSKITVENEQENSENSEESPPISGAVGPPGETPLAETEAEYSEAADSIPLSSPDISESSSIEQAMSPVPSLQIATPMSDDVSDILSPEERSLGKLHPFWVPDADAPNCMQCEIKFTVLKRRHHCRACGKVLCSKCCSLKSRLEYLDNSEARVCHPCYSILAKVFLVEQGESALGSPSSLNEGVADTSSIPLGRQPNPNNPMEYCSTIPPLEQAASVLRQPPPSVLVPVGVLKREGSSRSRSDVAKQVIFSDGIRPGGDLTELDGSSESRLPYRRPGRVLKRVGTPPGPPTSASNHSSQRLLPPLDPKTMSYIPTDRGLPPLAVINKGEIKFVDVVDQDKQMAILRSETEPPTVFAINRNLFVQVKILNLDCCVSRTCWCFSTSGMSCVGQDEIVIILECLPDEATVPKDIFRHLNTLYQDASRGNTVSELGHTVFQGVPFLDSTEHGGFIYIRPSFQCLQKLVLPSSPYLVAILVHRWETPWATVFPIRLMLRLGAQYRYYPCMLVSIRNRRPVYWEIGHTIINLLADFRNLSYTLPSVRGLVIHMEDRQTSILLPKNRYDQVTRALNNSNDHVLALASNFSFSADSHLVCIQSNRDESYHTQAINIHNKPRKVTGASFVVFNGALKTSSNLTAKSSIVEDGLMVQITPDTMQALRGALRNMQDFSIGCGPAGASEPDELVNLKWVQDDKNFNIGVKSSIDGRALDGVPSIRVHNGTDYMGSCRFIRWTEVFILQSDEGSGRGGDPLDISRLSESLARATCLALIKLLDLLAQAGLTKLGVRATVHPENVGYEAGSKGEKLPPIYMDSLDNELVPVLHKAASMSQDNSGAVLELIFHIMLQ
ncbi:Zinc finger FYVE domain-containing protein 9 [Cryptotermes secundus]|uniref:Zinc finger FYVE domain-containing protein 9 n=4 Tax=Cryptotermes secundus TaxID=105785 RepID=A0A2J7PSU9_9NEOP|nr:Zinc finger FYVE domain-containing protein 9 [Cryptotermes secundus]PNF19408.1 Zinc finger FYVE domain-containing protein 9 [Cryptotermes secundus]PNF19409.1 Zinc finger FYVE domain-containing protein 9 [Cryptotermes secundus]PNF19410.1 Zinc finger FYVE domain-containing protein 9 [Cryptotermes secundus]